MAGQKTSGSIWNVIGTVVLPIVLAIAAATWLVRGSIDEVQERVTQTLDRVKVIEGFLREKYPEFSNFARKESLSRFDKEVARLIVIPAGAQRSVGTLSRFDPQGHLIAVENSDNQPESFHIAPETEVWVWIPTMRRVRRLSGLTVIPPGSAVVVVYAPSDRKVRSIVFVPPSSPAVHP